MEGEMQLKVLCIPCPICYAGQQNLTFFLSHEHQWVNLAALFVLNSNRNVYRIFFIRQGLKDTEELNV